MKRIVFCFLVLIGAIAGSNVSACAVKKTIAKETSETIKGVLCLSKHTICLCVDENGDYCPECGVEMGYCQMCLTPSIDVGGEVYFLNARDADDLVEEGYKDGDEVEVTGYLHSEYCVNYVEIANMRKMTAAIDDVSVPFNLDPEQPMYNMLGVPVDVDYKGVVIQDGHKFVK